VEREKERERERKKKKRVRKRGGLAGFEIPLIDLSEEADARIL